MSAFSWDKEEEKTDTFEIPIVIRGQRVTEKRKLSRSCSTKLDPKLIPVSSLVYNMMYFIV